MKIMVSSLVALSFVLCSSAHGMNGGPTATQGQPEELTDEQVQKIHRMEYNNQNAIQIPQRDFVPYQFGQHSANDQSEQSENATLNNRLTDARRDQDLNKSSNELEQLKNQRWRNRINGIWKPKSEKADLRVCCVGIDEDRCILNPLTNTLHIKKGNTKYELIRSEFGFALYSDTVNSVNRNDLLNGGKATLDDGSTITVTKESKNRPWVRIQISDKKDENALANSLKIGWKPEKSDLIIYSADYNKPCAFAGHSVHMVNGKSGVNKFPKNLTVLADSFVNFGKLYVCNGNCRIISPSIVLWGKTTKALEKIDLSNPTAEEPVFIDSEAYIAFCNKYYPNGLDLSDYKGFYDYGNINVDNVNLEDLNANISGSFEANNVNMYHYGRYALCFSSEKNVNDLSLKLNEYLQLEQEPKYKVNITNLNGSVGCVSMPDSWSRRSSNNKGYMFENQMVDVNIANIGENLIFSNFEDRQKKLKDAGDMSFFGVEQDEKGTSVNINGVRAFIKKVGDEECKLYDKITGKMFDADTSSKCIKAFFEKRQEELKKVDKISFSYVKQSTKGALVKVDGTKALAFIKKIGEGKYEFRDVATDKAFDAEVSKKLADKIQDDFNVLKGQLERAEKITFSKLEDNKHEIALIGRDLINKGGIVAYFNIEGSALSQKQIAIFIRNVDGNLYFHDTLSEEDFADQKIAGRFTEALEQANITIKKPINYMDPNKGTPSAKTKDDKEKKKKKKKKESRK